MNTSELTGICVLVDGGCHKNNKPVSERSMYGSYTVLHDGKQIKSTAVSGVVDVIHTQPYETTGHASNQLAELLAMRDALAYVIASNLRCATSGKEGCDVTILSDSEYALGHAQTFKPGKGAADETIKLSQDLKLLAGQIKKAGHKVSFQHVDNGWVKTVLGH